MEREESRDDIELMTRDEVVKHGNDSEVDGTTVHVRESMGSGSGDKIWDADTPV